MRLYCPMCGQMSLQELTGSMIMGVSHPTLGMLMHKPSVVETTIRRCSKCGEWAISAKNIKSVFNLERDNNG